MATINQLFKKPRKKKKDHNEFPHWIIAHKKRYLFKNFGITVVYCSFVVFYPGAVLCPSAGISAGSCRKMKTFNTNKNCFRCFLNNRLYSTKFVLEHL